MELKNDSIPEILTEFEAEELLEQPNLRYPTGERNYTIIVLILKCGLKLSEVTSLTWDDVDLYAGELKVKGDEVIRSRTIYLKESLEVLSKWQRRQKREIGNCEYVITTLEGNPVKNRYVRKMIDRYANKAHLVKNVSPQTLRHTYGANLYKETEDLNIVRKSLGLSDLNYTKMYSLLAEDKLEYV